MSTFLVADDNDGKALMLEVLVRQWGQADTLLRARTTEEAKEIIQRERVDFAFIDYYMPSEDGPAVIAHLKATHPNCRVALVSSANNSDNAAEATEAGAEAIICTSFQADEVERAIKDILQSWE